MSVAIHWFRRDLRIGDNLSLAAAARDHDVVLPVFILDDRYRGVGPSRLVFLRESLEELDRGLRTIEGRLLVVPGPAARALPELVASSGASAGYANEEIGSYPERRDTEARASVEAMGAKFRLFQDGLSVDPRSMATDAGHPYTVFTPFSKKWRAAEKPSPVPAPASLSTPPRRSVPILRVDAWKNLRPNPRAPRGGEPQAARDLQAFLSRVGSYAAHRDFPAREGTSRLSAALHFGTISARTVLHGARQRWTDAPPSERASIEKFAGEMGWREFFHSILIHFPHVEAGAFRREFDGLEWNEPSEGYAAWTEGRTGFPFIDAAMRQLLAENWMHNRARMAVASFLTKDLHIDWRIGARWFEANLVDADLANNNGGWQWAAGTGADAAPYFRVFNPDRQSRTYDPQGEYIRRYVPELAHLADAEIHEPRNPIIDHAIERAEALRRYSRIAKKTVASRKGK